MCSPVDNMVCGRVSNTYTASLFKPAFIAMLVEGSTANLATRDLPTGSERKYVLGYK